MVSSRLRYQAVDDMRGLVLGKKINHFDIFSDTNSRQKG